MSNCYGFIQARMRSTRLPGKVVRKIGSWTMLDHVIYRALQTQGVKSWRVVTSNHESNKAIWSIVKLWPVELVVWDGGPEEDVLGRFHFAAADLQPDDYVLRVTADCPGWDSGLGALIVKRAFYYFHRGVNVDLVANTHSWPDGLDAEVMTVNALREANSSAHGSIQREHVTSWMQEHHGVLQVPAKNRRHWRFSVDTEEDLQFIREIHTELGRDWRWQDVEKLVKQKCLYPHPQRSFTSISGLPEYEIPDLHEVTVPGGVAYVECPRPILRKRRGWFIAPVPTSSSVGLESGSHSS